MEELFKDSSYVNQELVRIRQQTQNPDSSASDWEVIFKVLGLALVHAPEDRVWLIQAALNEAQTRHSFWLQSKGMGIGTFVPLV